jgi:hypothetical protein
MFSSLSIKIYLMGINNLVDYKFITLISHTSAKPYPDDAERNDCITSSYFVQLTDILSGYAGIRRFYFGITIVAMVNQPERDKYQPGNNDQPDPKNIRIFLRFNGINNANYPGYQHHNCRIAHICELMA